MYYPDIKEYITSLFFMLDEFSTTQEQVFNKRKTQDLCRCFAHRLLHRYDAQRDHRYARTAGVFVSSPPLA